MRRLLGVCLLACLSWQVRAQAESLEQCVDAASALETSAIRSGSHDWAKALQRADGCIASFPQAALAYVTRAQVYMAMNQAEQAIQDYTQAIALNANDSEAYVERGQAHFMSENHEAALKDYARALAIDPANGHAYLERGILSEARFENAQALADFQQAIARVKAGSDLKAVAYKAHLSLSLKMNKPELAIADAEALLKIDESSPEVYRDRALAYELMGKYAEAIQDYSNWIGKDPDALSAYARRAELYLEVGHREKAEADLRTLLRAAPNEAFIRRRLASLEPFQARDYYQIGMQQIEQQESLLALISFTTCLRHSPDALPCMLYRGNVHAILQNSELALEDYNRVIGHASELGEKAFVPYLMRGILYAHLGQKESAIADLRKVLQINPQVKAARSQLDQLGAP